MPQSSASTLGPDVTGSSASQTPYRSLAWLVPALAALAAAAVVEVTQGWTNSHLFGHGSLFGPVVLSSLVIAGALTLYALSRRLVRPQHRFAYGISLLLPALYVCLQLLLMGCEGCAASG